jgi:Family of unknown function (DUF6428)
MKISELKKELNIIESLNFQLPNGNLVPENFHVTEVGVVTKNFIDCGGTVRNEKVASLQLWSTIDVWHRLKPEKLLSIIDLSEKKLGMEDLEIEVEYQGETIEKFGLEIKGKNFELTTKKTDCLARKNCVLPNVKQKVNDALNACCTPGGGCC